MGWNRSPRETLIILESSVLQDGVALLTDHARLSDEEEGSKRSRLLSVPEGEALPERAQRVQGA